MPSSALKWVYLVAYVGMIPGFGGLFQMLGPEARARWAFGLRLASVFTMWGCPLIAIGCSLLWLYASWKRVPAAYRVTRGGRHVSPAHAVFGFAVPLYNIYWLFAVNAGLCDAIDYILAGGDSNMRTSRALAVAACICSVVPSPCLVFASAPPLWFFHMLRTDAAQREMVRVLQQGLAPAPYM